MLATTRAEAFMEVNVVTAQETFLAEVSDLVQTELTKYLSDDFPIAMVTSEYLPGPDDEDYLRTTVFFEDRHPELDQRALPDGKLALERVLQFSDY